MTVDKAEKGEKLTGLNHTLTAIENSLLRKRSDRADGRYFKLLDTIVGGEPPDIIPADGAEGSAE
jgi:hypothetical protein